MYHLEATVDGVHCAVYKSDVSKELKLLYILPEPYKYDLCKLYECKTGKCILEKRQAIIDAEGVECDVIDENGNKVELATLYEHNVKTKEE